MHCAQSFFYIRRCFSHHQTNLNLYGSLPCLSLNRVALHKVHIIAWITYTWHKLTEYRKILNDKCQFRLAQAHQIYTLTFRTLHTKWKHKMLTVYIVTYVSNIHMIYKNNITNAKYRILNTHLRMYIKKELLYNGWLDP